MISINLYFTVRLLRSSGLHVYSLAELTNTEEQVKNYFQRRIDSGQTDFADIVTIAEAKKERGEPTGPLPDLTAAPKRRYEATPSTVVPRPLAPHTEVGAQSESRLQGKGKAAGLPSQTVSVHSRTASSEKDRSITKYPPLAQATSAPLATATIATTALHDEPSRVARSNVVLQQRFQGPRLGYFTEDRRDSTLLAHTNVARAQEGQVPPRQTPVSVPEVARVEPLVQSYRSFSTLPDVHGSPLLSAQGAAAAPQQAYVQQPPTLALSSHSRHPSLTGIPSSPVRSTQKLEPEISPVRRDSFPFRQYPSLTGQPGGIPPPQPVVLSAMETSQPPTPAQAPEPPRQVPAKRSNIINILNDEPEEPQPRKRFAGEQAASTPGPSAALSRSVYTGPAPPHQEHLSRQEEAFASASQQRVFSYSQPSQYLTQPTASRSYSEYGGYQSMQNSASSRASNDWMARFDPRGQQQQQLPGFSGNRAAPALTPQPVFSPYNASQSQQAGSLTAPSPAPTPPPASAQRPTYHSVLSQGSSSLAPASPRIPSLIASSREVPHPGQTYRPNVGSPPPRSRSSSVAYVSRQGPPTPIQSPVHMLNITSRQPSGQVVYASSAPTPQIPSNTHATYQPHVQQQPTPHHRTALSLAGPGAGQYAVNTPPSQAQVARASSLSGTQPAASARSYTPPAVLHPNPTQTSSLSSLAYAANALSPSVHSLQQRHSGSGTLTESARGVGLAVQSDHHRTYSQGSNPLPGPLAPHPPR